LQRGRFHHARRFLVRLLLVCCGASLLFTAAACPYAGHYLIVEDALEPSDAIVVLAGARAERWLEAVDLYRERMAPRIVLSPGMVEPAERRLRGMGIRLPSEAELARDAIVQLGVPASAVTVLPSPVDNTADEAAQTRAVALAHGWTSLIITTSKYHSRRTRYAFRREFSGTPVRVHIRASRYDEVSPDGWWKHRRDVRYVVSELQKLAAYRLGLGR
jgi:uncharacterized SAM-binding protein YcdF (DUF218 family)